MIDPMTTARIADTRTAAAATSLANLADEFFSIVIKSTIFSRDVFINSAIQTNAMVRTIIIHSTVEILK